MSDLQNVQEVTVHEATTEILENLQLIGENDKLSMVLFKNKLNELIARVNELSTSNVPGKKARDRGPDSERQMTDEDAEKIMLGEHKDLSHKDAAMKLGLSYGQVYSARKGFTFKTIYQKMIKTAKAA
jgi:hypothetical protein